MQTTIQSKSNSEKDFEKCLSFLKNIGIETRFVNIKEPTFLPGLSIESGIILIDLQLLKYPGDILHEAGHIAVVPFADRSLLSATTIGSRDHHQSEEMMAIAWSYAVCIHLEIDPYFVFHDEGYKGGGSYIADNFKNGGYIGLPMLQWKGMAADNKNAAILNVKPYPHMLKWALD